MCFTSLDSVVKLEISNLRLNVFSIAFNYYIYRSNKQIKSHGQKIALRMSQGENVLEELDTVEVSEVAQETPATSNAVTDAWNLSIGAHPQSSSSVVRNERPAPVESAATTEAASVALMLCELKTTTNRTATALEDSSAFVTPSIP
jgi:uncharacterized protein YkwD